MKDCDILEFFVWQMVQHPVPLSAHLVAQKFTFQEARITDRYDIFVDMTEDIPFHTTHEMTVRK